MINEIMKNTKPIKNELEASNPPTPFSKRGRDWTAIKSSKTESLSFLMQLSICLMLSIALSVQTSAQEVQGKISLLELGVGARALGMGGAYASLGGDADSLMYNPAGLAFMESSQLSGYISRPFEAFNHLAMGYALPNFGVSILEMNLSSVMETNEFGNPTGRALNYVSRSAIAGFGYEIVDGAAFGAQVKLYNEESGPLSGFGWAVDPAILYRTDSFSLGAVWRNAINENIEYDNDYEETWTDDLVIGGSWKLIIDEDVSMLVAADVSGLTGEEMKLQLGSEMWLGQLGLRLGLDRGQFTAGASVLYRDLQIHWAYAFHDTLPQTLRLSAAIDF